MFDVKTLKACFLWGWIDEDYLAQLVEMGKLTESEQDMITGQNVIPLKQKNAEQ